jgi:hypothetical protein
MIEQQAQRSGSAQQALAKLLAMLLGMMFRG